MSEKAACYATITDNRTAASLHVEVDGIHVGQFDMDAPELDALIAQLGKIRSMLVDQVPAELDPNARLQGTATPVYRICNIRNRERDEIALSLRHPGYGWLTFHFDRDAALVFAERARRASTTLE